MNQNTGANRNIGNKTLEKEKEKPGFFKVISGNSFMPSSKDFEVTFPTPAAMR